MSQGDGSGLEVHERQPALTCHADGRFDRLCLSGLRHDLKVERTLQLRPCFWLRLQPAGDLSHLGRDCRSLRQGQAGGSQYENLLDLSLPGPACRSRLPLARADLFLRMRSELVGGWSYLHVPGDQQSVFACALASHHHHPDLTLPLLMNRGIAAAAAAGHGCHYHGNGPSVLDFGTHRSIASQQGISVPAALHIRIRSDHELVMLLVQSWSLKGAGNMAC